MHGPIPTLTDKVVKNVEDGVDDDFPDLKEFMESIKVVDQNVYALKEPNLDFIAKHHFRGVPREFHPRDAIQAVGS
jgi:hypothetical protein